MACPEGLEPPTCCLEGSCSIQLSYGQPSTEFKPWHLWPWGWRRHCPQGFQRDNHKALRTTLTLLMAMAAPATMGLSQPIAARGMPTTL